LALDAHTINGTNSSRTSGVELLPLSLPRTLQTIESAEDKAESHRTRASSLDCHLPFILHSLWHRGRNWNCNPPTNPTEHFIPHPALLLPAANQRL